MCLHIYVRDVCVKRFVWMDGWVNGNESILFVCLLADVVVVINVYDLAQSSPLKADTWNV